jgi:tripartite-type tricarboxylate transporter receptor subunit TctC
LATAGEQGYPSLNVTIWVGLFAPTGTPPAIVDHLATEIRKAMAAPDVRKSLTELGADIVEMPRDEFARVVRDDVRRWAQVIREGNLTAD